MPFDGSGNFTRVHNWQQDRDNGIRIVADRHDQEDDNFAQGFNQTFLRNGIVPMAGALNMNGNPIRGVAGGSAAQPTMTSVLDPLSGYFSPSSGQLGVSIAGTQRGLWTAAGLSVSGALNVSGNVTVGGNLVFTGNLSVPGTLAVTGASTFSGQTTHNGGLVSSTGLFTGALTGAAASFSGNVSAGGTFAVTGVSTFTGKTTHNGGIAATVGDFSGAVSAGSLSVTGVSVFTGKTTHSGGIEATTGSFSGAVALGGPLTSTGAVTLLNLNVTGAAAFGSTVTFTGKTTHSGGLEAANGQFNGTVSMGALTATTGNFSGAVNAANFVSTGGVTFGGLLTAQGNATINQNFVVGGSSTLNGPVNVSSALTVAGTLTTQGTLNVAGDTNTANLVASNVVRGAIVIGAGAEAFRAQNDSGVYAFYTGDASARTGYISNSATNMVVMNERAGVPLLLGVNGSYKVEIKANGDIDYPWAAGADLLVGTALPNYFIGLKHARNNRRLTLASQSQDGDPSISFATGAGPTEHAVLNSIGTLTFIATGNDNKIAMRAVSPSITWNDPAGAVLSTIQNASGQLFISNAAAEAIVLVTGGAARLSVGAVGITTDRSLTLNGGASLFGKNSSTNAAEWFVGSIASGLGAGEGLALFTYGGTQSVNIYTAGIQRVSVSGGGQVSIGSVAPNASTSLLILTPAETFRALNCSNGANADFIVELAANLVTIGSGAAADVRVVRNAVERARFTATGMTVQGTITASGDITAFSDGRFKTNVRKARGLAAICGMEGVTFEHISSKRPSAGVIAQELIKVAPELVYMDDRGHYSVNYNGLAAYFIEAIKELNSLVARNGNTE